jgi:hypothetical protein
LIRYELGFKIQKYIKIIIKDLTKTKIKSIIQTKTKANTEQTQSTFEETFLFLK